MPRPTQPNFDPIAKPYRLLERLTLGRTLERCRLHFLPTLQSPHHHPSRILTLGDGDGRFLAALLAQTPNSHATAVDTSAAMLTLLRTRCEATLPHTKSSNTHKAETSGKPTPILETHQADALTFTAIPPPAPYDLIATHFFLDCLTQPDLDRLAHQLAPQIAHAGQWLVSDFRIPPGPLALPARLFIRSLYLAFRILTGLRVTALPDHPAALTRAGLTRTAQRLSLGGLLTTELWSRPTGTHQKLHPATTNPPHAIQPIMDEPSTNRTTPTPVPDPIPNPEPATPSAAPPDPSHFHPTPNSPEINPKHSK